MMNKYKYLDTSSASSKSSFTEASLEELRVLVTVMEAASPLTSDEIAKIAGVSASRAKAAVAFWESEEVISTCEDQLITHEFAERVLPGEIEDLPATRVAKSIRDQGLADLCQECAALLGKPVLTTEEIKNVTALVTQYALTPDYLLTLAAYLASKHKITVARLRDKAISLANKGIDTTEALEVYIKDREEQNDSELEFRRLLGIYNRATTSAERKAFNKWADEFGYSVAVVGEAYSICVSNTGSFSLPYMDKILCAWHEAGCKTVEECRAYVAQQKTPEKKENAEPKRKRSKSDPPKPRYGDFDVNDAFSAALARSYED